MIKYDPDPPGRAPGASGAGNPGERMPKLSAASRQSRAYSHSLAEIKIIVVQWSDQGGCADGSN